jgi:hypothetical protein
VVIFFSERLLVEVVEGLNFGSAHGSNIIIPEQVAKDIEQRVFFGGGAASVRAFRIFMPVII